MIEALRYDRSPSVVRRDTLHSARRLEGLSRCIMSRDERKIALDDGCDRSDSYIRDISTSERNMPFIIPWYTYSTCSTAHDDSMSTDHNSTPSIPDSRIRQEATMLTNFVIPTRRTSQPVSACCQQLGGMLHLLLIRVP